VADQSMNFNLYGTDKTASKAIKQVGQTADETARKSSRSFADIGKALGAVGIVKFGADSVRAFTDAEKSQAKLTDAFQRFPKLADTSQQAIEDLSTALAQKTRFDDDATNSAAALLAQFNLTGRQIQTLLPLVQDYAAKTGTDLDTAATQLGKSLLGQTRALKSVGINYTSTGDKAKDFANITGLLSQKLGGFAENEGKTAAGQMEILKNQFGEVEEAVGGALVPALSEAAKVLLPIIKGAGQLVSWFGQLPGPVKLATAAVLAFKLASKSDFLVDLASKFRAATTSAAGFKSAAAGIGKTLAAGGALAGAGFLISAITDSFHEGQTELDKYRDDFAGLVALLESGTGKITAANREQVVSQLEGTQGYKDLRAAGASYAQAMDILTAKTDQTVAVQQLMNDAVASGDFDRKTAAMRAYGMSVQFTGMRAERTAQDHKDYIAALDGTESATRDAAAAYTSSSTAADKWSKDQEQLNRALKRGKDAVSDAWQPTNLLASALDAVSSAASDADESAQFLAMSLDKLAGKDIDAEQAARANAAAMREMVAGHRDLAAAKTDVAQKTDDLAAAQAREVATDYTAEQKARDVAAAKRDLASAQDGVKDAADREKDAQDKAAQSAIAQTDATFQNTLKTQGYDAAVRAATSTMAGQRAAFIASAQAAGLSKDAAVDLANAQGLIPSNVRTTYESNAYDEIQRASALNASISHVDGRVVHYTILGTYATAGAPKGAQVAVAKGAVFMAAGGLRQPQVSGQPILWGEAGPEAYIPLTNDSRRGRSIDLWRETGKALGVIKMAAGGIPSAASFAGVAPRSLGDRESVSVGAFRDVRGWIGDLRSAAQDLAHDAIDAATEVRRAVNVRRQELADVRSSNAEKIRAARLAVGEAKTTEARAKARARLNAVEDKASDTLARATAEQNRKVAAARRESEATSRSALAANRKASAEEAVWNKTTKARAMTQALAQQVDTWTVRLGAAKDRLANLQGQRNDLAGSIGQFGGGILGFAEQRTNAASIIAGQKYDLSKVQGFRSNLSKLKALGLNSTYLSQIAAGGDDGMRIAAALASGSKSQISQVNRYASELVTASRSAADTVYGKPIADATKALNHAADIVHDAGTIMYHAGVLLQNGFDLKWNGQVMAKALAAGQRQLARR
jgi:hypothetical protein